MAIAKVDLYVEKTEDGYWLFVETKGKQAIINLGFPENIVGDILEEAAEHRVQSDTCPACDGATVVLSSFGGVEDCVECGGTGKCR